MTTAPTLAAYPQAAQVAAARPLPAHIPELDGVRGVAVLLVMVCHSAMWMPNSPLRTVFIEGRIGVDLFFVLSGFLITGILLDTQGDRRALRNFYIRRGLRIWPLYFGFLLFAFTALRRMAAPGLSPWVYLLFAQNFVYFANSGPALDPMWSLAVEEQFYLIWPWIALRARRETVLKICCAVIALSPLLRCVFHLAGAGDNFLYVNTLCRLDGIAAGGALAAWIRNPGLDRSGIRRPAGLALLVGAAGMAICYCFASRQWIFAEIRGSFVALTFVGFVALTLTIQGSGAPAARLLRGNPLSGLGRISYALYLFNLPIYTIMHGHAASAVLAHFPSPAAALARLAAENLCLLAAAILSWKLYEGPILKLKSRWAPRRGQS